MKMPRFYLLYIEKISLFKKQKYVILSLFYLMTDKDTNQKTKYALGIDLGTKFSTVSILLAGRMDIVEDKLNKKAIPSIVNFAKKKRWWST